MNKLFSILQNDISELKKASDILRYSYSKCIAIDLMDGIDQNTKDTESTIIYTSNLLDR
ncbi:MAG: hypothetical protein HQK70_06110 [Desulfamplus sp.]|nr:hypothetical protein [Desulfamplus sp.]